MHHHIPEMISLRFRLYSLWRLYLVKFHFILFILRFTVFVELGNQLCRRKPTTTKKQTKYKRKIDFYKFAKKKTIDTDKKKHLKSKLCGYKSSHVMPYFLYLLKTQNYKSLGFAYILGESSSTKTQTLWSFDRIREYIIVPIYTDSHQTI